MTTIDSTTLNILIFAEDYLPHIGGIASHVHELALALLSAGCGVEVMTTLKLPPKRNLMVWQARRLEREGVPVVEVPVLYSPKNVLLSAQQRFRFAHFARKEIVRTNSSVFHWHNIYFDPNVAKYVAGSAGMVFTNHSSQFLDAASTTAERPRLLQFFNFAHRLIAPSREILEVSIQIGYPAANGRYLPNGVDTSKFCPNDEARQYTRARLRIPEKAIVLFCPRRVVPKCGVIYFAQALKEIDRNEKIIVLFPGFYGDLMWRDFEYENEVRQVLSEAPPNVEVRMLGQLANSEMLPLYRAADISILPSLVEATSIAGLESMACGLPLIGTNVGGIPDLILHGDTGLLVPPADPNELARAINELISCPDQRSTMGMQARKRAIEQFNWNRIVRETIKIYEEATSMFRMNGRVRVASGRSGN
jgi:glycosyltransferase involved in cell wall biosynthesis